MKRLALVLLGAALVAALAGSPARAEQTFWSLSSGAAPSPWPTPSYWPVDWYGSLYYPVYWPVCTTPAVYHCRPRSGHLWPPHIPPGQHPVPRPMPAKPPA